jgi:hypothetical protein
MFHSGRFPSLPFPARSKSNFFMKNSIAPHCLNAWSTAGKNLLFALALLLPAFVHAQTPPVIINSSASYDGGGSVLNGAGSSGYFVQGGSLSLSNATMANFTATGGNGSGGGAGMGGAIFINQGASVTLNNVNFISDTAKGGNGGYGNVGGSLNNLFNNGTVLPPSASGSTPTQLEFTDIGGTTGTNGVNGVINTAGIGGMGGSGGNGGNGGDHSETLVLSVTSATAHVAADVALDIADSTDPFLWSRLVGDVLTDVGDAVDEANQITALVDFDQSLANGQIGLGGPGGSGGSGGAGSDFFGGGAGGAGGTGGVGGKNWSSSAFQGGAAGGPGGPGGIGGLGGFGAGGGIGGAGGVGGTGATFTGSPAVAAMPAVTQNISTPASFDLGYFDPTSGAFTNISTGLTSEGTTIGNVTLTNITVSNGTINSTSGASTSVGDGGSYMLANGTMVEQYYVPLPAFNGTLIITPATSAIPATGAGSASNGVNGFGGVGGGSSFGGGTGAQGASPGNLSLGGNGGNAEGGAIFVRAGGTLTITGNAAFDNNQLVGGQGELGTSKVINGNTGGTSVVDIL